MIINGDLISTPRAARFAQFADANPQLGLDADSPQVEFLKAFADITIINGGGDGHPFFLDGLLQGLPFSYREEGEHAYLRVAGELKTTQREIVDVDALDALAFDMGLTSKSPTHPQPKKVVTEICFPYSNPDTALYAGTSIEDTSLRKGWEWVETLLRLVEALTPRAPQYSFAYELFTEKDGKVDRTTGEASSYYIETAEEARQNLIESWRELFERFPGSSSFTWSEEPTQVVFPLTVTEKMVVNVPESLRNSDGLIALN